MDTIQAVQRAIEYMEEQLYERLETERIAEAAAMSVPNLYRVFYALTGHPIKEYIRKRRTSQAANLLRQTKLPVIDIAFECGFDSYQAFTKSFKKLTGLTPGVYRKSTLFYSFERVDLLERISYMEEKDLSEQYPDVKVIRVRLIQVVAYQHYSERKEGLEEDAIRDFYNLLVESGINLSKARLFGFNLDEDEYHSYGYQVFASYEGERLEQHPKLFTWEFPGGLYAINRIPAAAATSIVTAWNRMFSEWLPRSTFALGDHTFVEEYMHFKGTVTRMKLYLPVIRKQEQETIEIVDLQPIQMIVMRASGADSPEVADKRMVEWLESNGLAGDERLQLFMCCSYGVPLDDDYWYELGVSVPRSIHKQVNNTDLRTVDGGLYACLKTGAYGAMTGVLDLLYRWLSQSDSYEPDENRQWFAKYVPGDDDLDRTTLVECYVPVGIKGHGNRQ